MIYNSRTRRKMCGRKEQHPSQGKADAHARHLNKRNEDEGAEKRFHSYFCVFCKFWHVGGEET